MTITTLSALIALTGCGVRLETSPPKELVPTQNEIARQALVNDLVLVQHEISNALASEDAKKVVKSLNAARENSTARETALGGVYISGLPESASSVPQQGVQQEGTSGSPEASLDSTETGSSDAGSGESEPLPPAPGSGSESSADTVIARLLDSSARVRTSLEIPDDPKLARLFTSVAIGQVLEANSLSKAAGVDLTMPPALTAEPWSSTSPDLDSETLLALISSEDYAGYAFEVAAAMGAPEDRAKMVSFAREHRQNAENLARVAEVTGKPSDPRKIAYALPLTLDSEKYKATAKELSKLLRSIELELAQDYLTLVEQVSATDRAFLFDMSLETAQRARSVGAKLDAAFPLMELPELIQANN